VNVAGGPVTTTFCVVEDEVDDEFGGVVDVASSDYEGAEGFGDDVPAVEGTDVNILDFQCRHVLKRIQ